MFYFNPQADMSGVVVESQQLQPKQPLVLTPPEVRLSTGAHVYVENS